jgi:hypothetical protein
LVDFACLSLTPVSVPKLHHYVPRFYLERFADASGRFWCWNKLTRAVFRTNPSGVAAENHFYRIPEFIGTDVDPLILEHDLAMLEGRAAEITRDWTRRLDAMKPMQELALSPAERTDISIFIAVQFLRTAEQRDILSLFALKSEHYKAGISGDERVNLHARMMYSGDLVERIAQRISESIWLFARNSSLTPFWTSDNPVAFKTGDNRMWLKGVGILTEGSYAVFPLSPSYVLYAKEPSHWSRLKELDCCLSPVDLSAEMVKHENAGQVFMATRFVISSSRDFRFAAEFVETIGTDVYAPKGG